MLVSSDWLGQYVDLSGLTPEELGHRLTMSGLNLEEIVPFGSDFVIDLEVTSNRPDCLGHLGVAREVAALLDRPLCIPSAQPKMIATQTSSLISVAIEAPEICSQYHGAVLRGVTVRPSPAWLQQRLQAVGIACVNNIVDATNYVMLECAQPLHAFDLDQLRGSRVVVRTARTGEVFRAINQKSYTLTAGMGVIADAERPVALAGVMGGQETEISSATTTVLLEGAAFAPLAVRQTARLLSLHSPSSYRFERALDPLGPQWAVRRCAELILELAGGELLAEPLSAGVQPAFAEPIRLRYAQFRRILGIDVPVADIDRLLGAISVTRIGQANESANAGDACYQPPSWRRDLTREIDLIEEVARLYGYEQIPGDVLVPLCASSKSRRDRVTERLQQTLVGCGFYESLTVSFVSEAEASLFQPRAGQPALFVEHSTRRQDNLLRQSLVPSLLSARRLNERRGNFNANLFEIAKVYLSTEEGLSEQQAEPWMLSLVSGHSFLGLKGVLEQLVARLNPTATLQLRPSEVAQFTPGRGTEVWIDGRCAGWFGELHRPVQQSIDLRDPVMVAELDLQLLDDLTVLIPASHEQPVHQAVQRDLNFVLSEDVLWEELVRVIRPAAGPLLESIGFGGQYRGKQLPDGCKSYVVSLVFRSLERTLTGEEVDLAQQGVIAACHQEVQAVLRA